MPRKKGRSTQIERSSKMRQRLVAATIACLAQEGYGRTTIGRITARAKVSHGATGHHFPNKAALIAAAAEELVRRSQQIMLEHLNDQRPETYSFADGMEATWSQLHSSPLMRAFLELSLAAHRDRKLAAALQKLVSSAGAETARRIPWLPQGNHGGDEPAAMILLLTRSLLLGMALQYHGWGANPQLAAQRKAWARLADPFTIAAGCAGGNSTNVYEDGGRTIELPARPVGETVT